jgi:hypothetical protein
MIFIGNIYAGLGNSGGGMVNTLDNGLTLTGTNGQLGGNLLHDTTVTPNTFDLNLGTVTLSDTEATCSSAPVNPTDLVRLEDLPGSPVRASNRVTGVLASENLITYTVPGSSDNMFRINTFGLIRVLPGVGSMYLSCSYTDNAGNAQTFQFTAINTALEATANPAVLIEALHGTNITIDCVLSGAGIVCDFSTCIEFVF